MLSINNVKIAVLGDGSWGTSIAMHLVNHGRDVTLWGYDPKYINEMSEKRENIRFLPGFKFSEKLKLESNFQKITSWADIILVSIPTKFLRDTLIKNNLQNYITDKYIVSLVKGLEQNTLKRPSQIITETLGSQEILVLSGPSHAEEVAMDLPASVVVAAENIIIARKVQELLTTPNLRIYASDDIVGVEIAGAIKNVISLAVGMSIGLELGDNAFAALITRGLAELRKLGMAMGGKADTFFGLAGMGDLITTCVSKHGRNRAVGIALSKGKKIEEITTTMSGVSEGINTLESACILAEKYKISMPITKQIYKVLKENKDPKQAVNDLMNRAIKDEF